MGSRKAAAFVLILTQRTTHRGYMPIRQRLLEIARRRGYTTYGEIAPLVGLDTENPDDRNAMSQILADIARAEQAAGRPMLTAVVIRADQNMPGDGFFTIAQEFGRYAGGDRLLFWIGSLNEVHEYWQNH